MAEIDRSSSIITLINYSPAHHHDDDFTFIQARTLLVKLSGVKKKISKKIFRYRYYIPNSYMWCVAYKQHDRPLLLLLLLMLLFAFQKQNSYFGLGFVLFFNAAMHTYRCKQFHFPTLLTRFSLHIFLERNVNILHSRILRSFIGFTHLWHRYSRFCRRCCCCCCLFRWEMMMPKWNLSLTIVSHKRSN